MAPDDRSGSELRYRLCETPHRSMIACIDEIEGHLLRVGARASKTTMSGVLARRVRDDVVVVQLWHAAPTLVTRRTRMLKNVMRLALGSIALMTLGCATAGTPPA